MKIQLHEKSQKVHKWFAWYPVTTSDTNKLCWLCYLNKQYIPTNGWDGAWNRYTEMPR